MRIDSNNLKEAEERNPQLVRVAFSGATRKTLSQAGTGFKNEGTISQRPEELKADRCIQRKCEECDDKANCFHGVSGSDSVSEFPTLILFVKPGLMFTKYRASVHAKCNAGEAAEQMVRVHQMKNGRLKILVDGIHKRTINKQVSSREEAGGHELLWKSSLKGVKAFELTLEFIPIDLLGQSSVNLDMVLNHVRLDFEKCLDQTNCLKIMGDQSKASYALRNQNKFQLKCLERASLPSFLQAKCRKWRACVEKNPSLASLLKTALKAAVRRRRPNRLQGLTQMDSRTPVGECVDPAYADPESFECECMAAFHAKCGDDEQCFKDEFCKHNRVCRDWKIANSCPENFLQTGSSGQAATMLERGARANSGKGAAATDSHFESALTGKCTSETQ